MMARSYTLCCHVWCRFCSLFMASVLRNRRNIVWWLWATLNDGYELHWMMVMSYIEWWLWATLNDGYELHWMMVMSYTEWFSLYLASPPFLLFTHTCTHNILTCMYTHYTMHTTCTTHIHTCKHFRSCLASGRKEGTYSHPCGCHGVSSLSLALPSPHPRDTGGPLWEEDEEGKRWGGERGRSLVLLTVENEEGRWWGWKRRGS